MCTWKYVRNFETTVGLRFQLCDEAFAISSTPTRPIVGFTGRYSKSWGCEDVGEWALDRHEWDHQCPRAGHNILVAQSEALKDTAVHVAAVQGRI